MQKITPFLWFDDNAEAAIQFYTSSSRCVSPKVYSNNQNKIIKRK